MEHNGGSGGGCSVGLGALALLALLPLVWRKKK
ncbi:MAG: SYNERG-CTERM sorting domain-containing protein [Cloacibacillus sp.]|nr:SYNERG-CTERM sorting domain-containing protein [Cloacibacillus sp.]